MSRLQIYLLGPLKVYFDGAEITETLRTRKERAILAYLAEEADRSHSRETVSELFWPNRPESYARMNLRQALVGIRKVFGGEEQTNPYLRITEETVQINSRAVWLDTIAFNEHLHFKNSHSHAHLHGCVECIQHLERATQLYRGEFLEGMLLGDVTSFQEWIVFRRERHFRGVLTALQALSAIYYKREDYDQAYQYAWRYVDLAPLEESAHRLLMKLLALSGRRSAAIQQYQYCQSIIARELGIEPSAETVALYEQIKSGQPVEKIDTGNLGGASERTKPAGQPARSTGSLYDPVTNMPLRPLFIDRIQHAIRRMERAKLLFAVCLVNVAYPDHPQLPEELLKQVEQHLARRLLGSVRESDTVARLKEDEFGLILEEIKDPRVLQHIAEKIAKNTGAPVLVQGQRVNVELTFGVSVYPLDGADPLSLLNQADIALRTARNQRSSFFVSSA